MFIYKLVDMYVQLTVVSYTTLVVALSRLRHRSHPSERRTELSLSFSLRVDRSPQA